MPTLFDSESLPLIKSFEISDNGAGFNNANFESFLTADSPHKIDLGCKGVGRFVALKAFNEIEINSVYNENGCTYSRNLFINHKELTHTQPQKENQLKCTTIVKLKNYKQEFKKHITTKNIAYKIIDHCIIYFINNNAPQIYLNDLFTGEQININALFDKIISQEDVIDHFEIQGNVFELFYIKKYKKQGNNQIHYCADDREVIRKPISKIIPSIKKAFTDKRGDYFLSIFVKSKYLDERVMTERNSFNILQSKIKNSFFQDLTFSDIELNIAEKIKENYKDEILAINEEALQETTNFIFNKDGIEYRHLLKYSEVIESIPPGLPDDKLDLLLHKYNYKIERNQKNKVTEFLEADNTAKNMDEYKTIFSSIMEVEQELQHSKLANYLYHRKTIIKLLDRVIRKKEDGKYAYESQIHDIIFPRMNDSDSVNYKDHNLWILDERLTYHQYVSSDRPLSAVSIDGSDKEPDLLIFDKRFAFAEDNFSSVVIFEFKRPMRRLSGKEKAVHNQVLEYIEDLMETKAISHDGRYINVTKDTPKFGYVICDYDRDMEDHLIQMHEFNKTPKNTLINYRKGINLILEIINYDTLVKDIETRHKAFFKEMGIHKL